MMATSRKVQDELPGEIELLLPWFAAGTLGARDSRRVEEALAADPELAHQYASVKDERAETILLNESLGAPSMRTMHRLFAAIDAEPPRVMPSVAGRPGRFAGFVARLSPRALGSLAAAAVFALLLQAGVIGTVLMNRDGGAFQTASLQGAARQDGPATITRSLAPLAGPLVLVKFAHDARVADIIGLLSAYGASIVDGDKTGLFRLQLGEAMSSGELAGLVARLERETIVSRAIAGQ